MKTDIRSRWARWRNRSGSVRVRTSLVAVAVIGVVLVLAGLAMSTSLRRSLAEDVGDAAEFRAESIATVLSGTGEIPQTVEVTEPEDEFVQVLDDSGGVIASSENLGGSSALHDFEPGVPVEVEVPFEEDDFVATGFAATVDERNVQVVVGHTLEDVNESVAIVNRLLLVGLPLLLLVVAVLMWFVVGRALTPVERIRERVRAISSDRLDLRVPVPPTEDEIARLATTMNEMLQRLEESQARQRRFVSDASHELRSPVASIRQHVEVALQHPGSTSTDELARTVLSEDLRIQRLVEDLLILARMDEGAMGAPGEVDLDDVVFEEVERRRSDGTKRIDTARVSGGRVAGDERQFRRLVANLLDNALRHAAEVVGVSLSAIDGRVVLEVEDDGSGIAQDDRQRVFERFVRLDEARSRDAGGAGLGLAIVSEVARAQGGSVEIAEAARGGALFRVTLPARG